MLDLTMEGGDGSRIGPNAVIQTFAALEAAAGRAAAVRVARAAGCLRWLDAPPERMIDERAAARLFRALEADQGGAAAAIEADAGRRTADYILAHRIPGPVQWVLRLAPPRLAARMLLSAISRHAWTFAGSGAFSAEGALPCSVEIRANPLAQGRAADHPACDWHAAVFTRLFRELVHPSAEARETACCAAGAPACRFEIAQG